MCGKFDARVWQQLLTSDEALWRVWLTTHASGLPLARISADA
jgi:hypothetical protein